MSIEKFPKTYMLTRWALTGDKEHRFQCMIYVRSDLYDETVNILKRIITDNDNNLITLTPHTKEIILKAINKV